MKAALRGPTLDADRLRYGNDGGERSAQPLIVELLAELDKVPSTGCLTVDPSLRQRVEASMRASRPAVIEPNVVGEAPAPPSPPARKGRELTLEELEDVAADELPRLLAQASLGVIDPRAIERLLEQAAQSEDNLIIEYLEGGVRRRTWIQVERLRRRGNERILEAFDCVFEEDRAFRVDHLVALALLPGGEQTVPPASKRPSWKSFFGAPKPVIRTDVKVGRNDRCPCGSGNKYKKCCLAREASHA